MGGGNGDDPGGHANTGGRFSVALTKTRVRTRLGVVTVDDFKALRAIADAQDSPLEHELVDMASAIWQGPASLSDVLERQKSGLSLSILADDVLAPYCSDKRGCAIGGDCGRA